MESLNLFTLFSCTLGLVSAGILCEFFESFVFDTIRLRGYTWQFTAEFLFVVLRHIEDSSGRLTLVNAIHFVHLRESCLGWANERSAQLSTGPTQTG